MMQDAATFTIGEAARTPVFWCLTLTELAQGIVWTGINFHCVDLVESGGNPATAVQYVFLPLTVLSTVVGAWVMCWIDRVEDKKAVFAFAVALYSLTALLAAGIPTYGGLVPVLAFGVTLGTSCGLQTVVNLLYPELFGRANLGTIQACRLSILNVGAALGPLVLALCRETIGYAKLFVGCAGVYAVMALLVYLVPYPPTKTRRAAQEIPAAVSPGAADLTQEVSFTRLQVEED